MGIHENIGHHLLEFLEVPLHRRQIDPELEVQPGDGSADLAAHDHKRFFDDVVHGDGLCLSTLLDAGKILQVRDDPVYAVRTDAECIDNLRHVISKFFVTHAALPPAGIG